MTGEISFFGVFVPALLVAALAAGVMLLAVRRVLTRTGFYRHVWHATLVDLALYVILLGTTVKFVSHRASIAVSASIHSHSVGVSPASGILQ